MSDLISRQAVIEAIDVLSKSPYATQIQFGMERREVMNKVKKLCVENIPTVAVMEVMHCDDLKASECCQVQATKMTGEEVAKQECQKLYNQLMETEKDAEKEFERLHEEIRVLKEINPIVRSAEEVAELMKNGLLCDFCPLLGSCKRDRPTCYDGLIDWLTKKEVIE